MQMTAIDRWRDYMKSHDRAALWDLLHPDAVFESPVVHTPQRGREITFKYLASAGKVLGDPGFKYVGEWHSDNGAVLEFENDRRDQDQRRRHRHLQRRRKSDHAFQGDGPPAQGDQPAASADGRATGEAVGR
jgi:SnoaL-like domain